jgi:hypothetical protein
MGFILSPLNNLSPLKRYDHFPFALDNGSFGGRFDPDKFMRIVHQALLYQSRCLFVVCPDVLADPAATNDLWREWYPRLHRFGFKVAYVAQDGVTNPPWHELSCLFAGGTTEFKLSNQMLGLLREAGERGKWRHIGRVNSRKRIRHFWGNMDSFDGTDWCRSPRHRLNFYQRILAWEELQSRWSL